MDGERDLTNHSAQGVEVLVRTVITALAGFVSVLALWGCEDADIETYPAPKDEPVNDSGDIAGGPGGNRVPIAWTLPSHWEQEFGSGMRYATLLIGPADRRIEMRVTPLGAESGVVFDNVKRYWDMVGRSSISREQLREQLHELTRQIVVNAVTVTMIDVAGPEPAEAGQPQQRLLAAIVPAETRVWHFMAIGPTDVLEREKPVFEKFLRSIRLPQEPAPAPVTDGQREEIEYQLPKGWIEDTSPRPMRLATFNIEGAPGQVEVTITSFTGDVGGLINNINRWRVEQLGMERIDKPSQQPAEDIDATNARGVLLEMTGPATAERGARRMLVALFARSGWTWFIKIHGEKTVVDAHRGAFLEFVQSIRFVDPVR